MSPAAKHQEVKARPGMLAAAQAPHTQATALSTQPAFSQPQLLTQPLMQTSHHYYHFLSLKQLLLQHPHLERAQTKPTSAPQSLWTLGAQDGT